MICCKDNKYTNSCTYQRNKTAAVSNQESALQITK